MPQIVVMPPRTVRGGQQRGGGDEPRRLLVEQPQHGPEWPAARPMGPMFSDARASAAARGRRTARRRPHLLHRRTVRGSAVPHPGRASDTAAAARDVDNVSVRNGPRTLSAALVAVLPFPAFRMHTARSGAQRVSPDLPIMKVYHHAQPPFAGGRSRRSSRPARPLCRSGRASSNASARGRKGLSPQNAAVTGPSGRTPARERVRIAHRSGPSRAAPPVPLARPRRAA